MSPRFILLVCLLGACFVPSVAIADIWSCREENGAFTYKPDTCDKFGLKTIERVQPPEPQKPKKRAKPAPSVARDKETIFREVVGSMIAIKRTLRDPDSVVWEYAGSTASGDTVCIQYRAKNGFGGYDRALFVADDKGVYQTAAAWNRRCAEKALTDWTYAKHALP